MEAQSNSLFLFLYFVFLSFWFIIYTFITRIERKTDTNEHFSSQSHNIFVNSQTRNTRYYPAEQNTRKKNFSTKKVEILTEILLGNHLFYTVFSATNDLTVFYTYPIENSIVLKTKLNFRIDKNKKNQFLWRMEISAWVAIFSAILDFFFNLTLATFEGISYTWQAKLVNWSLACARPNWRYFRPY